MYTHFDSLERDAAFTLAETSFDDFELPVITDRYHIDLATEIIGDTAEWLQDGVAAWYAIDMIDDAIAALQAAIDHARDANEYAAFRGC